MTSGKIDPEARQRRARVAKMRDEGAGFREIAKEFGISPSRASQLYADAMRDRADPPAAALVDLAADTAVGRLPLGRRGRGVLINSNFATLGDLLAFERRALRPHYLALPNAGRQTWNEIAALLDAFEARVD